MIDFEGLLIAEGYIWAIQKNTNLLVKINNNDFKVEKVCVIDDEKEYQKRARTARIIEKEKKLFIFFYGSCNYYIFDIEKEEIKKYAVPEGEYLYQESIIVADDRIILMPAKGMPWLISIEGVESGDKLLHNHIKCDESYLMARCADSYSTTVYSVDRFQNKYYQTDTLSGVITEHTIGEKNERFWGVKRIGNQLVLIHIDEALITIYDLLNDEISVIDDFPDDFYFESDVYSEEGAFVDAITYGKYVYLFPYHSNMILRYDSQKNVVEKVFSDFLEYRHNNQILCKPEMFTNVTAYKDKAYIYDSSLEAWIVFDLDSLVFNCYKYNYIESDLLLNIDEEKEIGHESILYDLDDYIRNVLNEQ